MESLLRIIKKLIPGPLFRLFQPFYHLLLSYIGAVVYRLPSRKLYVIGITGTKGKSSVAEILNAILEEAGYTTALASTIRFKVGDESKRNLFKMTMPGRLFMQRFMRKAIKAGCTHLVLEMTSEGAKQSRHKNIALNALIFTNLSPEHIEAHGSFENYLRAKLKLRDALSKSRKKEKIIISNFDDEYGERFLKAAVPHKEIYTLDQAFVQQTYPSISFAYEEFGYESPLQGEFNVYNLLAAIKMARHLGIEPEVISRAISKTSVIPGRVEHIDAGQEFDVVVDYAHTKDSLEKLYKTFETQHMVCVLGNTGGGRDTWKRPEMAKVAEQYCDEIILTDEDPYDEDPKKIVDEMAAGMEKEPTIIMNRREAIAHAFTLTNPKSIVLITGKGTDPYIMRANGVKEKWSDTNVAREELKKLK
jgi:UDP-N-acetylmuramoyl-L-alanyl-D-glutamate--2,6-diaminopimelate ligase